MQNQRVPSEWYSRGQITLENNCLRDKDIIAPVYLQVPLRGRLSLSTESVEKFEERFDGLEAVVAGAAGGTGQAITKKLLTSSGAKVKGLVRDTSAAVHMLHAVCKQLRSALPQCP